MSSLCFFEKKYYHLFFSFTKVHLVSFSSLLLKKALYRAKHRGSKEADLLLGGFVETHGLCLSTEELLDLNFILNHDDNIIFSWLNVTQTLPIDLKTMILDKLKNHTKTAV